MPRRRKGLASSVLPGSKNRAKGHKGRPGTWETLPSPSKSRLEPRLTNSRMIHSLRPRLMGTNHGTKPMVSPSEGNEARRKGRQGVAASHSTAEPGEPNRGTLGREGDNVSCTVGGQHGRSLEAGSRVTATITDRQVSDGMG